MELESEGKRYQIDRMPPVDQFHVARRYAPVIARLQALSRDIEPKRDDETDEEAQRRIGGQVGFKLIEAWGAVSDDDATYIFDRCLGRVRVFNGAGWTGVWNVQTHRPIFEDLSFETMLLLVMSSVQENLGPFTSAPPAG